jgi:uncharacterized membrane protein
MEGVEEVTQLSDRRLHWKVDIGGVQREFDAEIVEQIPDERIAWRTTDGPYQAGDVSFRQVGPAKTEVTLGLEFEPHGLAEKAGDALGFVSRRIEGDLDRFKSFVEQYGQTGAYRGRV